MHHIDGPVPIMTVNLVAVDKVLRVALDVRIVASLRASLHSSTSLALALYALLLHLAKGILFRVVMFQTGPAATVNTLLVQYPYDAQQMSDLPGRVLRLQPTPVSLDGTHDLV